MTQIFVINKHGKANLKETLLAEPQIKVPKNLRNLRDVEHARDTQDKKWLEWKRKLNDYPVLTYKKDCGITSFEELKGKEVEGELFSGCLHVYKIIN